MGPADVNWKPGRSHKFFIRNGRRSIASCPPCSPPARKLNPLIPRWFGMPIGRWPGDLLHCTREDFPKEFTGEVLSTL